MIALACNQSRRRRLDNKENFAGLMVNYSDPEGAGLRH